MKLFLTTVALAITICAHSQPLKEKLKGAIEKIEREEHSKNGEKVTSLDAVILSYAIIPLRDWWKRIIDTHRNFERNIDSLFNYARLLPMRMGMDSIEKKKFEENLKAFANPFTADSTDTSAFDDIAYFTEKYEQTPPSVKVYEVKYKLHLQNNWGGTDRDSLRRVLNMNDLSNADVH